MDITVRFILGTLLLLLCLWPTQTAQLHRPIRQVANNGSEESEKLQETENKTEKSIVANLTEPSNKPKTDVSTEDNKTLDKENSVIGKPQKSDSYKKAASALEIQKSIDIEKYVSKEFHSRNNVYTLPVSPDTEKYVDPDFNFHSSTDKHDEQSEEFDYHTELTTPKSSLFDRRYQEAVESVEQKLEHIDEESHETVSSESDSKESINLDKLFEETKKNDTKAELDYVNYQNIITNDTAHKNSLHKDLVVVNGTNFNFTSSYNHTTIIDEDDSGNNTIPKELGQEPKSETSTLSNLILVKGDLDNAESSTLKSIVVTTRKSVVVTKPPSSSNDSHISILSNKIETDTVKAINLRPTEEVKEKGETLPDILINQKPINVSKRVYTFAESSSNKSIDDTNQISKGPEQLLQENQIISVHVDPPNATTTASPIHEVFKEQLPKSTNEQVTTTIEKLETTTQTDWDTTFKDSTIQEEETLTETPTTEISTKLRIYGTTEAERETSTSEKSTTRFEELTEAETMTSVVTETSVSPWMKVTTALNLETKAIESTTASEFETTIKSNTFDMAPLSDSTAAATTTEQTTVESVPTTEFAPFKMSESVFKTETVLTTERAVRTSKEMVFKETTQPTFAETTEILTGEPIHVITDKINFETTQNEQETTPNLVTVTDHPRVFTNPKQNETTGTTETDNSTEQNTVTDFYESTDSDDNGGMIAAITISSIGAVCLIILAGLLVIMRKRQKRFNYGQRCRPVNLDDYSMDNVSVCNSVRRKGLNRNSKRSYGNPAFEDPVTVTHPLNFPALGKFANNQEEIMAEFEEIPQITTRTNELPEGCDTKNRYANVIPLPETRVFLTLIDGYPNSDYINANYVTGPKNTKGYYIACQAPMQNTVDDFWRMVWEQQSKVILMLTHLFENGVEKCVDYLPPSEVLDCHRLFGDFQVTLKKREVKDKYIISSLQLKNMVANSWREVTHFWYLGWPEKGVPMEGNSLIAFLIEARSYMKNSSIDRKEVTNGNLTNGMLRNELSPVVVHCSPGTGRTGVVIACDIAIREFEQSRLIDVPKIVYRIRRDRASAVQTKEQYSFIYKVVNLYATKLTGGALDSL